jgi:hypothetical protein
MTTIQRIKQLLELDKVSISFKEAVLDNGTRVITEGEFVIGAPVFVIGENEEQTPAPDGEHIVPELNVVITTENGIITEVSEITAQVEEEQSTDETLAVTPEEQTAIISEVMLILDPRFAEIMLRLDEMEARMNEGKMLSDIESLKAQVEAFSKLPGGISKTVIDEPTKKNRESLENKLERFKRITKK